MTYNAIYVTVIKDDFEQYLLQFELFMQLLTLLEYIYLISEFLKKINFKNSEIQHAYFNRVEIQMKNMKWKKYSSQL